jgi:hypothetical protein
MEAICYSETSVLTRITRRHIPEAGILYSHRRENLKSYFTIFWNLFYYKCSCRYFVSVRAVDVHVVCNDCGISHWK